MNQGLIIYPLAKKESIQGRPVSFKGSKQDNSSRFWHHALTQAILPQHWSIWDLHHRWPENKPITLSTHHDIMLPLYQLCSNLCPSPYCIHYQNVLEIRICWWQCQLMWLCFSHIYCIHTVTLVFHGKEPQNLCEDSTIYLSNTNTTQMGPKSRKKTGRTKWGSRELSWEVMEWSTAERAIKRETDTKTKTKWSG